MLNKNHTLIIAEAGVNHNGDIATAEALIDAASHAGADIIKFQMFTAKKLATAKAQKTRYQLEQNSNSVGQLEMLSSLELNRDQHIHLFEYAKNKNIEFLSTGFDNESNDFLVSLGISRVKIPSGEINNLPYLRQVARYQIPTLLSTGMSTLAEIEDALRILTTEGLKKSQITVMHCTSEYPAPLDEINLLAMLEIRKTFQVATGYSDHSLGATVPLAAVALGATVIEKHITLSKHFSGPDHQASMLPGEFEDMVKKIRDVEIFLGDEKKSPTSSELKNKPHVRKSIVASTFIKAGTVFDERNITTKRPGTGINPMRWEKVVGQTAKRDFLEDEQISL